MSSRLFMKWVSRDLLIQWLSISCVLFSSVRSCPAALGAHCDCRNLPTGTSISCQRINLDELISTLDIYPSTIENLKIERSNIRVLDAHSLPMVKVKRLDLSNNGIEKVEEDAFDTDMDEITELILANNSLAKLPNLKSLKALEVLDISGNRLTDFEENDFINNPSMRVLKAKANRICSLSTNSLRELKNSLRMLDLSRNCFTQVPAQNVRGFLQLSALDLSDNTIESIQNLQFMNMPSLQELRLTGNVITEVMPLAFMNVPNLEILNLSNNQINSLDTTRFQSFENLQLLDISKNRLETLSASSFKDFPKLKELHLEGNRISTVETMAISNDPELRLINLANNNIKSLYRNAFDQLPSMSSLFLPGNKIDNVEEGMFSGMDNLQQISLRNNELTNIDRNAFLTTPMLSTIDLAENKLSKISTGVFNNLNHIFWLDLSDNKITTIQEGAFGKHVANLLLQGNPFHCDQSINWLVTYLSNQKVRTFFPGQPDITCRSPPEMAGKSFKSLMISKVNETMLKEKDNDISMNAIDEEGATDSEPYMQSIFPALDKLTNPLTRLLENKQTTNNLAEFIKKLQDILKNVQSTGPLRNISPELINYVLRGGQIPGVPPNMLKRFVENYAKSLVTKDNGHYGELPQLSAMPPELVEDVMKGRPVLGLTSDETIILRERYLRQLTGPNSTIASLSAILPRGLKSPFANLSNGGTIMGLTENDLNKIDMSKVPIGFLRDLVTGKTPDINDVPIEIVRSIVERNPTLFGQLVGQQLNKTIENRSQKKQRGPYAKPEDPPYDVSHLDRKGNLKTFDEYNGESKFDSGLITGIALGIVAMLTVLTTVILCYQRLNKNRRDRPSFTVTPNASLRENVLSSKETLQPFSSTERTTFCQPGTRCQWRNESNKSQDPAARYPETKGSGISA